MAILTAVQIAEIVNRGERVYDNRYTATEKDINLVSEIPVSDPTLPPIIKYFGSDGNAIGIMGKEIAAGTPTNNQVLKFDTSLDKWTYAADVAGSSGVWGSITGTLSSQTDLNNVLSGKVATTLTISAGTGLSGGGDLSTNRTLSLASTSVVAGSYTNANITVDAQGRLTAASNGTSVNNPSPTFTTLTDGATITWTFTAPQLVGHAKVTLAGNRTLAFSGIAAGASGVLIVTQDGTGTRTLTLPAGSKVINNGAGIAALSTAANAIDILTFIYDGTNYYWTVGNGYN